MGDRRGPPNIDGMVTIKVDNISYSTTPDDVRYAFEKFGDVGDVYLPRHHHSGESRGFAFVRFYREKDAQYAIEEMDGRDFRGRQLRIEYAKRRRPDDPRDFYSSRDGRDDRGGRYDDRDRRRSRSRERRRSRSPRRRSRSPEERRKRSPSRSRSRGRDRRRSPSPDRARDERRSRSRDHDKENDREKHEEQETMDTGKPDKEDNDD